MQQTNLEALMTYYAIFKSIDGNLFRFDTRIYLDDQHSIEEDGEAVGAIIGKNPGSASPNQLDMLAHLSLNNDKMLPNVRNRFIEAYQKAGKAIPENAFVQVWNLFYLCNPDLGAACSTLNCYSKPPECPSETSRKPKVLWFAWGGDDKRLNPFKKRFLSYSQIDGFYYSTKSKSIVRATPLITDLAKHPQGMPGLPIVNHPACVL
jgi:hypothetical protein